MIDPDGPVVLVPSPDVVSRQLDDEAILVDLRTDIIYRLTPSAAFIWERIVAGRDVASIRRELLDHFDVTAEQLDFELKSFLGSVVESGLVAVREHG